MKTYLRHYDITPHDVMRAYMAWREGESGGKNAHRVIEEYGSAAALIYEIYDEIRGRRLAFRPIHRYNRIEPTNGKLRRIGVESIKQQVCDYLVVTLLEPLLSARAGYYQVASAKGKGEKLCRRALRRWVRDGGYHVKMDVRQCYPSTSHDTVRRIYRRYVGSADVLYVIDSLLATFDEGGLEIGSYFSLRTMQLVLSFGYHHIEGLRKVRRGKSVSLVSHQLWYMDDVLLVSRDKRNLKMAARSLSKYMREEFGLCFKPWKVAKVSKHEPLDIGGWVVREYRHMPDRYRCTIRAGSFLRATRAFRRFARCPSPANARRCTSYWGSFKHGSFCRLIKDKGMGATFAHARSALSRAGRLENGNGSDDFGHSARRGAGRAVRPQRGGRVAAQEHRA